MTEYTLTIKKEKYLVTSKFLKILTVKEKKALDIVRNNIPIKNIAEYLSLQDKFIMRHFGKRTVKIKDNFGDYLYKRKI